jgi:hypothetical protein
MLAPDPPDRAHDDRRAEDLGATLLTAGAEAITHRLWIWA